MASSNSQQDRDYPGLKASIDEALDEYFASLEGERPCGRLYYVVQAEVEQALLERILTETGGNQRRAAELLGLNRNTLRKKLEEHRIRTRG
ncbi:helix-turn-helix domain-containing protein [Thiohalorhabdus sp.]|uniref:helix-turn-helix domain-containing protein n=1 Tax=Thiohalorhabdus sp. TaxID=3094134 RepID=UPI002FC39E44